MQVVGNLAYATCRHGLVLLAMPLKALAWSWHLQKIGNLALVIDTCRNVAKVAMSNCMCALRYKDIYISYLCKHTKGHMRSPYS